jgi:hypothetical protein
VLLLAIALLWGGLAAARETPGQRIPRAYRIGIGFCISILLLAALLLWLTRPFDSIYLEEPIATVTVVPLESQRFRTSITFRDGHSQTFTIQGDELYVDAHILKWKNWAQWFGLRNLYKLDRIGGRYASIEDEQSKPRSLFALDDGIGPDLYELRKRWSWLSPLVDAQYGSAAFVPADSETAFALALGPSGLIIRPLQGAQKR